LQIYSIFGCVRRWKPKGRGLSDFSSMVVHAAPCIDLVLGCEDSLACRQQYRQADALRFDERTHQTLTHFLAFTCTILQRWRHAMTFHCRSQLPASCPQKRPFGVVRILACPHCWCVLRAPAIGQQTHLPRRSFYSGCKRLELHRSCRRAGSHSCCYDCPEACAASAANQCSVATAR
jgi:hypothetical protein